MRTTISVFEGAKFSQIQFLFTQRRAKRTARNPSHLLMCLPIKPGVIFLTGLPSSVPHTMKLKLEYSWSAWTLVQVSQSQKFLSLLWYIGKIGLLCMCTELSEVEEGKLFSSCFVPDLGFSMLHRGKYCSIPLPRNTPSRNQCLLKKGQFLFFRIVLFY